MDGDGFGVPGGIAPPWSEQAEQAVLGALMLSPDVADVISGVVSEQDFYTSDHRQMFAGSLALIRAQQVAEPVALALWLKERGQLADGGLEYLIGLVSTASVANAKLYAEMVRDKAILRALALASLKMADLAHAQSGKPAQARLDEAQALLAAVDARARRGQSSFRSLSEALGEVVETLDEARTNSAPTGLPTGFKRLDSVLNPMQRGQLIVVGARPAVGKTSLALNIAMHAAMTHKAKVGMFSMEMTDVELAVRALAGYSGMAAGRFREHRLSDRDWDKVNSAVAAMANVQFYIDETGGLSVQELVARARLQSKRIDGFDLLVVDYLQLSRAEGRYDNRSVELGVVSSGLKALAKELNCPVIALSQLTRDSAKGKMRPAIHELRDSGSIESDADTILLLHRPFVATQDEAQQFDAEVIIGKQRNGAIGIVPLDYDAPLTRFFDEGKAPSRARHGGGNSGADYSARGEA